MLVVMIGVVMALAGGFLLAQSWPGRAGVAGGLLACVGLYAMMGQPNMPDLPWTSRKEVQQLAQLQELAQQRPNDPQPHYFTGEILMSWGKAREAELSYISALELDPGFTPALQRLADVRVRMAGGRVTPEIAGLYAELLRRDPENVQAAFMMGMGPWVAGDRQTARTIWAQAREQMPEGSPAREEFDATIQQIEAAMANVGVGRSQPVEE